MTDLGGFSHDDPAPLPGDRPIVTHAPRGPNDLLCAQNAQQATKLGVLPTDAAARKAVPIGTGVLDYFSDALAAIAAVSKAGNDQHNPGEPMHWARGKSTDQADCIIRHFMERGTIDTDGHRHSAKMAWRALALLQEEIEQQEGRPISRGSTSK